MRKPFIVGAAAAVVATSAVAWAATPILAPGNPIIAFDSDLPLPVGSSYPVPNETPQKAIDGLIASKYLNFGAEGSGFIVTPQAGEDPPAAVKSFRITTANDAEGRDPSAFQLFGTNSPILSLDNSSGQAEPWTLIASGPLALPSTRNTAGSAVDISNNTIYNSYKMIFPTLKTPGIGAMQLSEVQLYPAAGASGTGILASTNSILAVDDPAFTSGVSQSRYPTGEEPNKAVDQIAAAPPGTSTKYLNFGREHAGLIVTPSAASIVDGIQFTMANDTPSRDPAIVTIYGTNDPITSPDNGFGDKENWTVIVANLPYASPDERYVAGPLVSFPNSTSWTSYKIEIVDNKGPDTGTGSANSIQFAEVQLFSGSVPEPSLALMAVGGAVAMISRRRR